MSRILYVTDDNRPWPYEVCWWRLGRLGTNDDGNLFVQQIHLPPGATWPEFQPWSGHLDYFDGRNDWSWPFKVDIRRGEPQKTYDPFSIPPPGPYYLYVLDVVPPNVDKDSRWLQVTPPGNDRLPSEREIDRNQVRLRARSEWDFTPPIQCLHF